MSVYEKLLKNINVLAIVCDQFGDTGKGKFVDIFAEWADIIARGMGGANAGHTIRLNGITYVFHLIPSGILYDCQGKINVMGSGMAICPKTTLGELALLSRQNISYDHLMISLKAKLVLPQHIALDKIADRLKENDPAKGRLGTTGRGIGPAYTDHYARIGLTMNDLLNKDCLAKKLRINLEDKITLLKGYERELVREVIGHQHLNNGLYYDEKNIFNLEAIVEQYSAYGQELSWLIRDTDSFMQSAFIKKKKILGEGAQGMALSVDYGTYPFVTSSDCSWRGLAKGIGLEERAVDLVLGIVKFPYMTRVGEGPFITEFGGEKSAVWCGDKTTSREVENSVYAGASINSPDDFIKGVAVRRAGDEFGATTRRPRRTGWLDLPLLNCAIQLNGPNVILTKLDVFDQCEEIKICWAYRYEGPDYYYGGRKLTRGTTLKTAIPDTEVLKNCLPLYESFQGWLSDISQVKSWNDLPKKLKDIIDIAVKNCGMEIRAISVGADREQTIFI